MSETEEQRQSRIERIRLVIIESPYRALPGEDRESGLWLNERYLRSCIRDSLDRGEAPFASHRMYTDALDDATPTERRLGIDAGFAWHRWAHAVVVYVDRGITDGMREGIANAKSYGLDVEERSLGPSWTMLVPVEMRR